MVELALKKLQEKYGKDSDSRGMKYTRKALVVKFCLTEEAVTKLWCLQLDSFFW